MSTPKCPKCGAPAQAQCTYCFSSPALAAQDSSQTRSPETQLPEVSPGPQTQPTLLDAVDDAPTALESPRFPLWAALESHLATERPSESEGHGMVYDNETKRLRQALAAGEQAAARAAAAGRPAPGANAGTVSGDVPQTETAKTGAVGEAGAAIMASKEGGAVSRADRALGASTNACRGRRLATGGAKVRCGELPCRRLRACAGAGAAT